MKKFLITLKVRCGEYEFKPKCVRQAKTQAEANIIATRRARHFYGNADKGSSKETGFYFNRGEVCVQVDMVREISLDEFNVLEKHL